MESISSSSSSPITHHHYGSLGSLYVTIALQPCSFLRDGVAILNIMINKHKHSYMRCIIEMSNHNNIFMYSLPSCSSHRIINDLVPSIIFFFYGKCSFSFTHHHLVLLLLVPASDNDDTAVASSGSFAYIILILCVVEYFNNFS